ncbi:Pex12 amino terminal region-domain-containing protein [Obelidium mucronatum]|nr:Pex12 amino terminal region-domain-containing protein [Obelidium mucronatum]
MSRPSLFEVAAAAQLDALAKPALRYVLAWVAQQRTWASLPLARAVATWRFDALFLAAAVAASAPLVASASPALWHERFYGLRRVAVSNSNSGSNSGSDLGSKSISFAQRAASLAAPAAAACAADVFADAHAAAVALDAAQRTPLQRVLVAVYPAANLIGALLKAAVAAAYMFNKTGSCNLVDIVMRIAVVRMSAADYKALADDQSLPMLPDPSLLSSHSRIKNAAIIAWSVLRKFTSFASTYILPSSIFLFRFVEWWYAAEYHKLAQTQEPIPDPPDSVEPHIEGIPIPKDPSHCPLCVSEIKNPAMLPSGYVFCYPCIYKHVEKYGECPVSKLSFSVGRGSCVRRLYATS